MSKRAVDTRVSVPVRWGASECMPTRAHAYDARVLTRAREHACVDIRVHTRVGRLCSHVHKPVCAHTYLGHLVPSELTEFLQHLPATWKRPERCVHSLPRGSHPAGAVPSPKGRGGGEGGLCGGPALCSGEGSLRTGGPLQNAGD